MCVRIGRARSVLKWLLVILIVNVTLLVFTSRRGKFSTAADSSLEIGSVRVASDSLAKAVTFQVPHRTFQPDHQTSHTLTTGALDSRLRETIRSDSHASPSRPTRDHYVTESRDKELMTGSSRSPNVYSDVHRAILSTNGHDYVPMKRKIKAVQNIVPHYPVNKLTRGKVNRTGYVLALEFWDQQTFSVQNIISLQAWAGWLGVPTLEPFLMATKFGVPLADDKAFHANGTVSYLAMSDLYDVEQWNRECSTYHHRLSPLTPWSDFFTNAARDVIFVYFAQWKGCKMNVVSYNKTLSKLGFRIIRTQCIEHRTLTEDSLKAIVYGKNNVSQSDVSVVFDCWNRQDLTHVIRQMSFSMISGSFIVSLQPSKKLIGEAMQYQQNYLTPNGNYIAVLLRVEWLIMNRGPDKRESVLGSCLNRTIGWLHTAANTTEITQVFVGMDIGRFGSTTLRDLNMVYVANLGESFLKTAYRDQQMTLKKWENTFTDTSSSKVPGYMAFLQKTVAVHARCLLLVGYGSFQAHALQAYRKLHKEGDECYLKTDSQCRVQSVLGLDP